MKMQPDDPSLLSKGFEYVIGGFAALAALVWGDNKRRVAKVEKELEEKAEKTELNRQRDNIEKLFGENANLRKDMNGGFESLREAIHGNHLAVMQELARKQDRRKEEL